ncbi:hypothetical protein CP97_04995 [Aurantiacibacter atlanticus]|uniref:DUF1761 domain-containing protein n=1 Tax=Aurantiacibacter atlanticus TaxID=1648404 RepID=A0A0H4VEI7_9SPHN|nr:DUF1761 domain-containing protein [Aurantiacibacter atlanticus]AKQ41514.1 hypothetical protein CP97_04995 [Aurantiacibacter atlanticus]
MGDINLITVFLAGAAFFVLGALWYGPLFGKSWRKLVGITAEDMAAGPRPGQNPVWLIMMLCFAFELLIALTLAHQFAMTNPSDRAKMMIAIGYGALLMAPAIGINYLFQMRSSKLFAIDAGYFIAGMAAMGGVFVAFD